MKTASLLSWRGAQLLLDISRPGKKKFKLGAILKLQMQDKVSIIGHTVSDLGFLFLAVDLTAT